MVPQFGLERTTMNEDPLTGKERRAALRAFFIERRSLLKPHDVGLPSYGVRRCRGSAVRKLPSLLA
jgi:hypothetical protein